MATSAYVPPTIPQDPYNLGSQLTEVRPGVTTQDIAPTVSPRDKLTSLMREGKPTTSLSTPPTGLVGSNLSIPGTTPESPTGFFGLPSTPSTPAQAPTFNPTSYTIAQIPPVITPPDNPGGQPRSPFDLSNPQPKLRETPTQARQPEIAQRRPSANPVSVKSTPEQPLNKVRVDASEIPAKKPEVKAPKGSLSHQIAAALKGPAGIFGGLFGSKNFPVEGVNQGQELANKARTA